MKTDDELKQVKYWEQIKENDVIESENPNKDDWFLVIKLHHFDQRVYGDFKVTFKSKDCQFYFWLNASAILYNNKLKELSQELNREVPIHFEEMTEIEETQQIKEDKDKIDLVYPEE